MSEGKGRRGFVRSSALATAGVALGLDRARAAAQEAPRKVAASDRIRVGFIGLGNRGSQLLQAFMGFPDVEVAALCDVYEPFRTRDRSAVDPRWLKCDKVPQMGEDFGHAVDRYQDFRRVLDRKDIDAVCIATPDHWHAVQAIAAMQAGKDVYVEKPLTITVAEGRKMVAAQERTRRVAQVGLNRRGSVVYRKLAPLVQAGHLGKVSYARAYHVSNMYPDGIGRLKPEAPPKGFDWDAWLGPRAFRPYQYNVAPYYFRWWADYSSQMGNWGVHYLDVIRWLMGEQAPVAISAHGGRFAVEDDRTIPDTMEVTFEFASGALASFGIYEGSGVDPMPNGEIELRGTKATLYADEDSYSVAPSRPGQFQSWKPSLTAETWKPSGGPVKAGSMPALVRDFLDCVKSRGQTLCPLEEGHRSTCFAHLANIAWRTRARLEWDPRAERFTNHAAANDLLHYEYRKPWTLG